jgi:hypothetical protein
VGIRRVLADVTAVDVVGQTVVKAVTLPAMPDMKDAISAVSPTEHTVRVELCHQSGDT